RSRVSIYLPSRSSTPTGDSGPRPFWTCTRGGGNGVQPGPPPRARGHGPRGRTRRGIRETGLEQTRACGTLTGRSLTRTRFGGEIVRPSDVYPSGFSESHVDSPLDPTGTGRYRHTSNGRFRPLRRRGQFRGQSGGTLEFSWGGCSRSRSRPICGCIAERELSGRSAPCGIGGRPRASAGRLPAEFEWSRPRPRSHGGTALHGGAGPHGARRFWTLGGGRERRGVDLVHSQRRRSASARPTQCD